MKDENESLLAFCGSLNSSVQPITSVVDASSRMGLNKEDYWWYRDLSPGLRYAVVGCKAQAAFGASTPEEDLAPSHMLASEWASRGWSCFVPAHRTQSRFICQLYVPKT